MAEAKRQLGSKRQLESGAWELSVSLGSDLKGNRIRKYDYTDPCDEKEAEILLAEFIVKCHREGYAEGDKMLLSEFAPLWQRDHVEDQLRNKTKSRYSDLLGRVLEFLGDYQLGEIVKEPTLLKQFYHELQKDGVRKDKIRVDGVLVKKKGGLSLKTIRHHHALLSSMFSSAMEWNLIKVNPCSRVKPPRKTRTEKTKKKKNFFTIDQAKQFLQALNNLPVSQLKYKVMVFIAICTGFRRGEVMGLEWLDFNLKKNYVSIERTSLYTVEDGIYEDDTKTESSERTIFFPVAVTELLKEYKEFWEAEKKKAGDKWNNTDRLFVQWNGKPMHPDTISQWFPEFIRKNNLPPITYHGLRHTYGSILIAMGMNFEDVAAILGHENVQMLVQTYGHSVKDEAQKEAAQLIDTALLKNEVSEPEPVKTEPNKIPDSLPEDIRQLIEKLIATYAPATQK